jgi:tetratricopeptide (TPR) repeat protein
MNDATLNINSKNLWTRLVLVIIAILVILFGWYSVRLQLGSMLSELTVSTDPDAQQKATVAGQLAPGDPAAKWLAASIEKDKFSLDSAENSLKMFEDVIRLSPYDFRWWIELGRAYEQAGRLDRAEAAFKRAIELAPHYTFPHWQTGNFYLRQDRSDDAFAEFRKTTENNLPYREQVFSLAWEYFDKDASKVEQFAGDSPNTRAYLALFFASKRAPMDSLRIWNTLSDEQKNENANVSKVITQSLYERRLFRAAVEFSRQNGLDPNAQAEAITNAGFEKPIAVKGESFFGWNIEETEKVKVEFDPNQKHEGARGLRLVFSGYAKPDLLAVWQTVAIQPRTNYRLSFWVKTENLKTGGPPAINVMDGADNKLIAVSKAFPTGTNDWQEIVLDFATPENAEGVIIKTGRTYCGDNCPIVGTLWYDDFKLSKL